MPKFLMSRSVRENMEKATKDQRIIVMRNILTDKNCSYCKYLVSHISWWCCNEDAIRARRTRIPGVIHCPYFKVDKDYVRRELNIKTYDKMKRYKIAKKVNIIVCILLVVFVMRMAYNAWSANGPYTTFSFFASLVIHGGMGLLIYLGIDSLLKKFFK